MVAKYKIGDKLKCYPGFNESTAGSGYESNRIGTVSRISKSSDNTRFVYFFKEFMHGVYEEYLHLAEEKIEIKIW